MEFKPLNFRSITRENSPSSKIRIMDGSPLILVKKSGEAMYGRTRAEKDHLTECFEEGDLLLWAWVGQYHTDIFQLSATDLESYYK